MFLCHWRVRVLPCHFSILKKVAQMIKLIATQFYLIILEHAYFGTSSSVRGLKSKEQNNKNQSLRVQLFTYLLETMNIISCDALFRFICRQKEGFA